MSSIVCRERSLAASVSQQNESLVGGGSHGVTDSLLVAKMNSRLSFENSHHSNLEPDPAFGESQKRLKRSQQSGPALQCLLPVEGSSAIPGGQGPGRTAAKLGTICLVQPRNCASQDLFCLLTPCCKCACLACGNVANLSALEIIIK